MNEARALVDVAREQTGLEDFGGESFREGLEVLVRALADEAELHAVGREMARRHVVRLLASRLEIENWHRRHPEIGAQEVPAPIFVIGLPRTGTTALSALLARDPGTRSLRTWESSAPTPPPEAATQETDARIERARKGLELLHRMAPEMKTMHDAAAEAPTECQDLLGMDFRTQHFAGQYHVPSYAAWQIDCDMESAYRTHRRTLQLLQWRCPPNRWHLKTPVHMLSLDALDRVYPDARFVMTHRDPARVLGSVCSLIQLMYDLTSDWRSPERIGAEQLELWTRALERALAFRDRVGEARFADVPFQEQALDPLGAVGRAYARLGIPFTAEAGARIRSWAASHGRGRHGEHRYALGEFGLNADRVRERFRPYLDRFEIPLEGAS